MKGQTLKENKDFRRLYYRGKSEASPVLVTYAMKNRRGGCFYGITTSKKIGGAVERNRARRVIRAAYRSLEPKINGSWDFVFVARTRTKFKKSTQLEHIMLDMLKELSIAESEE